MLYIIQESKYHNTTIIDIVALKFVFLKTEYSFSLLKTILYSLNSYYEVKTHLNQLCQNMSDTFSPF